MRTDYYSVRFDIPALLDELGGNAEVHAILTEMGCRVKRRAVDKWRERRTITPEALAYLMLHQKRKRSKLALEKFIIEGEV